MAYLLNVLYVALLVVFSPLLCWRGWRAASIARGGPRSSWARPPAAPAIAPASGSTP